MKYIGKKLLRYGDVEVIGDEYSIPIPSDIWDKLISVASKSDLIKIMDTQVRLENYEAACEVKSIIDSIP